jgi:hypothetical protein
MNQYMDYLFSRFSSAIRSVDLAAVDRPTGIPKEFLLDREGPLEVRYIPFETVNTAARVVLVGLTPGLTQWRNAVAEAQAQLVQGATAEQAVAAAKRTGAFSGTLRPNLVSLLDSIGLHGWLQLHSRGGLFGEHASLLHSTSLLRHPVTKDGANYGGTSNPAGSLFLRGQIERYFAHEVRQLPGAVYVPLGPAVSSGLRWLVSEGVLRRDQIMQGLPHPSGANAERIAYFLGRKSAHELSAKPTPNCWTGPVPGLRVRSPGCSSLPETGRRGTLKQRRRQHERKAWSGRNAGSTERRTGLQAASAPVPPGTSALHGLVVQLARFREQDAHARAQRRNIAPDDRLRQFSIG